MKENVKIKAQIMDEKEINRILNKIVDEIIKTEKDTPIFVGIKTRGVPLANRLSELYTKKTNKKTDVGELDITFYRDDLTLIDTQPVVKGSSIRSKIDGKLVILVDDVLYTGRTIRAALDELLDFGRPKAVRLIVLIDRGHRELPICADYTGKKINTKENEVVIVKLKEVDREDKVLLGEKEERNGSL